MRTVVEPGPGVDRGSGSWWVRAAVVTVVARLLGIGIAGLVVVPFINLAGDLDRVDRVLAWLPGIVISLVVAGLLAGLAMGLRRGQLVPPVVAPLVIGIGYHLLGLAGFVLGGWGEVGVLGLEVVAILLALRFTPASAA